MHQTTEGQKIEDYDYAYPQELIAQVPLEKRHHSKMMVVSQEKSTIQHSYFADLGKLLNKNDLILVNNTQVLASRFFIKKTTGAFSQVFLLKKIQANSWKALLSPIRGLKKGEILPIYSRALQSTQDIKIRIDSLEKDHYQISFTSQDEENLALKMYGEIPLPPYIKRYAKPLKSNSLKLASAENAQLSIEDKERYQTLFASQPGAVAAPTAGLHFSQEIKKKLIQQGIQFAEITLHVGAGTFQPMKTSKLDQHQMHEEYYEIPDSSLEAIQSCRKRQGRLIVIGTTTLRALESYGLSKKKKAWTSLFIKPGFQFKYTDVLLTNFHQPKSSLLVLVSAFIGRKRILSAYKEAIEKKYRLWSYGDCMLLIKSKK